MIRTAPIPFPFLVVPAMRRTAPIPGPQTMTTVSSGWELVPARAPRNHISTHLRAQPIVLIPDPIVAPSPFRVWGDRLGEPGFYKVRMEINYGNFSMELRGAILTTADEDVFLALARLAQANEKRLWFRTTINEIVRAGWAKPAANTRHKVEKALKRLHLQSARIRFPDPVRGGIAEYNVSLVVRYLVGPDGQEIALELDPFLLRMFEETGLTKLNTQFRAGLSDVAKRLYVFLARSWGPEKTLKYEVDTLRRLIGLDPDNRQQGWEHRRLLKAGLDELRAEGFLRLGRIERNRLVRVVFGKARPDANVEALVEQQEMTDAAKEWKRRDAQDHRLAQRVPEGECHHGHVFGVDTDDKPACDKCTRWQDCAARQDELAGSRNNQGDGSSEDQNLNMQTGKPKHANRFAQTSKQVFLCGPLLLCGSTGAVGCCRVL
jgi:hypothetical protein